MKNSILTLLLLFFLNPAMAENLNIQSSNIAIDKKTGITVFQNNVVASDEKGNIINTEYAEFKKNIRLLESKGKTNIITSEGFTVDGENIIFDNKNFIIRSNFPATVQDLEGNNIYLENFEYSTNNNFFKSIGNIKVTDIKNNSYNFSQIYIDEIKKEIIGTDIQAFLNDKSFKINKENQPRIFANTVKINEKENQFNKSVFTLCGYRKNDKCPPWSMQASQMLHDKTNKTIYYDNAVIKVYDLPIFYLPKFSHPDPTVKRRSGFLTPSISDSKNLGAGFQIPYFWNLNNEKDITLTSKLYTSQHPLFLGEYRQAFEKSNLILDFGYTQGYKKTNATKLSGDKSHLFSKFIKNFKGKNNSENNFELSLQHLSHDKYLKLYKIRTDLIDDQIDDLENSLSFTHENDNFILGFNTSAYETLDNDYNDKYEYVLPDLVVNTNLISSDKLGIIDLQTNLKVHNYDTNKFEKFFVNDIDWNYRNFNFNNGLTGKLLGKIKNVNYETKNVSNYKKNQTSEFFGAIGYLSKINFFKETSNKTNHYLTPKILLRYAPGHMRKEDSGARLNHLNVFNLDRLNKYNNFESGLSSTIGFDYELKNNGDTKFDMSLGQIISEKENKHMPSSSSLDEKLSDLVGNTNLKINENAKLNFNYAIDQNYQQLNYSEVGSSFNFDPIKIDFNYLRESEHIGEQEYFIGKTELKKGSNGLFSLETKRNLITQSAEYYNLSYEYLNDCLKAGIVYRREFYNDSELEAENSLMFKITLSTFGGVSSPQINR